MPLNPYLGLVASQEPVQFEGSGARKRLSARGGVAYGTPRNWFTCFHAEPTWKAWDLPSSWPWVARGTEGADAASKRSRGTPREQGRGEGEVAVSALVPGILNVLYAKQKLSLFLVPQKCH